MSLRFMHLMRIVIGAAGSPLIVADDCTVLHGAKKLEYQVFDKGLPWRESQKRITAPPPVPAPTT
jgi:hypothetical protein